MRNDLRNRCAASFLAAALMAVPVAAQDKTVQQQLSGRLPGICADLQKQGWGVPADQLKMNPDTPAEMRMGEMLYMCALEHQLPGQGPGRTPDLAVLLTSTSGEPSLIFSANVWCPADREPAAAALAKEVERILAGSKLTVPAKVLEAVRASRKYETKAEGVLYTVEPVEVDAEACTKVPPGELGPVLMKMDVAVAPVP